jgi:hypothetical protein
MANFAQRRVVSQPTPTLPLQDNCTANEETLATLFYGGLETVGDCLQQWVNVQSDMILYIQKTPQRQYSTALLLLLLLLGLLWLFYRRLRTMF